MERGLCSHHWQSNRCTQKSAKSCQSHSKNQGSRVQAPVRRAPPYKHWRGKSGMARHAAVTQDFMSLFYFGRLFSIQKGFHYVSNPASNALFSCSIDLQGLVGIIDTLPHSDLKSQVKFYSGELESGRSMKGSAESPLSSEQNLWQGSACLMTVNKQNCRDFYSHATQMMCEALQVQMSQHSYVFSTYHSPLILKSKSKIFQLLALIYSRQRWKLDPMQTVSSVHGSLGRCEQSEGR